MKKKTKKTERARSYSAIGIHQTYLLYSCVLWTHFNERECLKVKINRRYLVILLNSACGGWQQQSSVIDVIFFSPKEFEREKSIYSLNSSPFTKIYLLLFFWSLFFAALTANLFFSFFFVEASLWLRHFHQNDAKQFEISTKSM